MLQMQEHLSPPTNRVE